ncbi:MAG: hypothetical protein NV67_00280 [Gammaproteobacteria bacterium (ex Lamellibrachia satsuma)]|nr:MAG: hypothetical protein HPY30_03985 [Gammaproteobacteria bacterium (ex Lamellibrachia satsuma)]QYZ67357.1 MAG: hypothetical protein HPY30_16025 [Gammaproteobacteria bacterium (ex Lamellibrachia satsuma)]RRS37626.1 MAG: hypothetical protein NV67_00280 [Gammaproteobacteria bacterium (ex Lamellibrachia satsuma)]
MNSAVAIHLTTQEQTALQKECSLTQKQLKRGVFTSVEDLEMAIRQFIDQHNQAPEPFVWTKSVDQILEKIGRAKVALRNV